LPTKQPAEHTVPLHTSPAPQLVPSATAGWVQVPAPSQMSLVQGLPSFVHAKPGGCSTIVQPPLPLQVELAWHTVAVQV
jgi:hypothetical protein